MKLKNSIYCIVLAICIFMSLRHNGNANAEAAYYVNGITIVNQSSSETILFLLIAEHIKDALRSDSKIHRLTLVNDVRLSLVAESSVNDPCQSYFGTLKVPNQPADFYEFGVIKEVAQSGDRKIYLIPGYGGGCPSTRTEKGEHHYLLRSFQEHRNKKLIVNTKTNETTFIDAGAMK